MNVIEKTKSNVYIEIKDFLDDNLKHEVKDPWCYAQPLSENEENCLIPVSNSVIKTHIGNQFVQFTSSGSVFLPLIQNNKSFFSTVGEKFSGGASASVHYVKNSSIKEKSRIFRVTELGEIYKATGLGDCAQASYINLIAARHGIAPYYYGAAITKSGNCYQIFEEMDFIENKNVNFQLFGETDDVDIENYNFKVIQKIQELCKLRISQGDIKNDNILLDKNQKVWIIDYGFAEHCATIPEAIKKSWNSLSNIKTLVINLVVEIIESEYKNENKNNEEKKELIEWFLKGYPTIKDQLIEKFCENDLKKLQNRVDWAIYHLKQKHSSFEVHNALHQLLIHWIGGPDISINLKEIDRGDKEGLDCRKPLPKNLAKAIPELDSVAYPELASVISAPARHSIIKKFAESWFVEFIPSFGTGAPIYLPFIQNQQGFLDTIGEEISFNGCTSVRHVKHASIEEKSRVYRITQFNLSNGLSSWMQKIASIHEIAPIYYGTALVKKGNEYEIFEETDFIKTTNHYNIKNYNTAILKKIKELCELRILHSDLRHSNIAVDEQQKVWITGYHVAGVTLSKEEAVKMSWMNGTHSTKKYIQAVATEIIEGEYKQENTKNKEKKELVNWFFRMHPKMKEELIQQFCEDGIEKLEKNMDYAIIHLKEKYNSSEEYKKLTELLIKWVRDC